LTVSATVAVYVELLTHRKMIDWPFYFMNEISLFRRDKDYSLG